MSIWDYITPRKVAIGILLTGFAIFILGYLNQHPEGLNWRALTSDFYANLSTELLSIAITVLVIDSLNTYHESRAEKRRLIIEMGSSDNGIALRAIKIMRKEYSYVTDGSLNRKDFSGSNLRGAELYSASLQGSHFHYADLAGVELYNANLKWAIFWRTNLEHAILTDADLSNAIFTYANLKNAKVTREQLKASYSLRGTILPSGKVYDGSFQLKGDIDNAKAIGIDTNNHVSLANWYAIPYDEFNNSLDLQKEKPESTDWN